MEPQIAKRHKQKLQTTQILLLQIINLVECVYLVNGAMITQLNQVIACKDTIAQILHQMYKYNAHLDFIAQPLALLELVIVPSILCVLLVITVHKVHIHQPHVPMVHIQNHKVQLK